MATRRRRTSTRAPSSTSAGRVAILLEAIQEQNRATFEAVQSQGTSIRREMGELERRLTMRIEALEAAVRQNSADIRQQREELTKVKEQLAELTDAVREKPGRAEFAALEARVTHLEKRIGA